jgi:hypothetical protein
LLLHRPKKVQGLLMQEILPTTVPEAGQAYDGNKHARQHGVVHAQHGHTLRRLPLAVTVAACWWSRSTSTKQAIVGEWLACFSISLLQM